ncbi:MAG: flagellar export protein FliJ [Pseudomonadota bacterium]
MKKRSHKIQKIVGIAKAEEQRSSLAAGRAQQKLDDAVSRLEELNAYRQGYAEQARQPRHAMAMQWQDHQQFLGKINDAVRSQQTIVAESEHQLEMHRRQWTAKRRRLESLVRVVESYRAQEQVVKDRREQRETDDMYRQSSDFPRIDDD